MIRRATLALASVALAVAAHAQTGPLTGVVVDAETGLPVAGASVAALADSLSGVRSTDADGRFVIETLGDGPATVSVRSLGYARLDTLLGTRRGVRLALRPETTMAAEVVVQARRSETATRAEAPVQIVPQAVTVLAAPILDAQGARSAADALRNVPGVAVRATGEPGGLPVLRGFQTDQTGGGVRRNGVEVPYLFDGLQANVARVEVLRGPASVLYGRLEPGGVVNFVTETPQPGAHREVATEAGTLGSGRLAVDVGGPLTLDRTLQARLNVSGAREVIRPEVWGTTGFVAPALRWQPSSALTVDVDAEAIAAETRIDPGLAAVGDDTEALDAVPDDRFFGEPDALHRWRSGGLFTRAAWRPRPTVGTRGGLSVARYVLRRDALDIERLSADGVARSLQHERLGFTYLKAFAFADVRATTGAVAHEITLGAEGIRAYAQADGDARLASGPDGPVFAALPTVDLASPTPTGIDRTSDVAYLDASVGGLDLGAFVQERATVRVGRGALHGVVAARLSHVRYAATIFALADTPDAPAGVSDRDGMVTALTPSAGLVAEIGPQLALYVTSGASFNPIVERVDRTGEPFVPTRGVQAEGGVKLDGRRAAATVAAFWIRKDNALTVGPGGFYDQTGRQRSRGVEAELRAEPLPGVITLATYTFLDAEVVEDDNVAPGTPLPTAPRHAGSVWMEATRGRLALRGGVWALGARTGDVGGLVRLPPEAVVDVGAAWTLGPGIAVRLDVRNALDTRGYTAARPRPGRPGEPLLVGWPTQPREIRLGVTVRRGG